MTLHQFINNIDRTSENSDKIKAIKYPNTDLEIYAYYDNTKCLHLLIDSEINIVENRKGLKIKNEQLDVLNLGKKKFLNFYCTSPEFSSNFIKIFEEILYDHSNRRDLEKSIKIIINKWYFFFEKENDIELNDQEVIGIIGELYFVKKFFSNNNDLNILDYWKGPDKFPNDFSFPSFNVEVKASAKEIGHVHTINGQNQIYLIDNFPLFIYSVSLKKTASESALTLRKLVNELIDIFSVDPYILNNFFEKLELLRINPYKCDMYDSIKVEIRSILTIKVSEDNIVSFTLENKNSRISNIKYDLDLNGLEDHTEEIFEI